MNDKLTHIRFILDRSGSMTKIADATVAGFNEFVEGQKNVPGECTMTLHLFDSQNPYEIVFDDRPVRDVPKLTLETFVPRASTPLHDAIGTAIDALGRKLKATPEADRPGKIIVAIMTDGLENSSNHYHAAEVAKLIEHQRSAYKWEFLFLAANQDACMTGQQLAIPMQNAMTYAATAAGTTNAMAATAANVARYRVSGEADALMYSAEQRKEAEGDDDQGVPS